MTALCCSRELVAAGFPPSLIPGTGWSTFVDVWSAGDLTVDGRPDVMAPSDTGVLYGSPSQANVSFSAAMAVSSGWRGAIPVL